MKKSMFISMCVAMFALYSCSQDESENTEVLTDDVCHQITSEQAVRNAYSFLNAFNGENTRSSVTNRTVSEVVAYTKNGRQLEKTRSDDNEEIAFYAVNFADDNGFVIAAADSRNEPVYAYVEKGNYNGEDTTNNPGFELFLKNIVAKTTGNCDESLRRTYATEKTRTSVGPYLSTLWGPGSPYNQHTQYTTVGSPAVALAQIAAYFQCPSSLSFTDYANNSIYTALDWTSILSECGNNNGQLTQINTNSSQVSYFMSYIEGYTNAESLYLSTECLYRMYCLGYNLAAYLLYPLQNDTQEANVRSYLDQGKLIYARGQIYSSDPTQITGLGHAWVIDGYNGNYFHCNWGWYGAYDGYYLSTGFVPYTGADYSYKRAYMYVYH